MITTEDQVEIKVTRDVQAWLDRGADEAPPWSIVKCDACETYGFADELDSDADGYYCNPECRAAALPILERRNPLC